MLNSWERFRDARITDNKHGRQTMDEVAAATGVSKNMISRLEKDPRNNNDKPESESGVKWQAVAKLAKHYGVSADYLMGLSEVKTPDINIRAMCDSLGLSEQTISTLVLANRVKKEIPSAKTYDDMVSASDMRNILAESNKTFSAPIETIDGLLFCFADGLLMFVEDVVKNAMKDATLTSDYNKLLGETDSTYEYSLEDYLSSLRAAFSVNSELMPAKDYKRFVIYEITTSFGNYLRSRYIDELSG